MKIVELDLKNFIQEDENGWYLQFFPIRNKRDVKISKSQEHDGEAVPPTWIQKNGLLVSLTLGYVVAGFGFTMLGSLLPFLGTRYRTSENAEGMLFLFFYIFGLLLGEIGLLYAIVKFRKQRVKNPNAMTLPDNMRCYLFGLACSTACLLLLWLCTMAPIGYPFFVTSCILFGFFLSFIDVSTNAMLSHNSETSAFSLNLLHFGFGVGSFSAPFIFEKVGIANTFLVFAIFAFIVFVISMGFAHQDAESQAEAEMIPMHQQMESGDASPPAIMDVMMEADESDLRRDFQKLVRSLQYWLIILAVLFYAGAELVLGGWIASMFIEMEMGNYSAIATIIYWTGIMSGRIIFSFYCHLYISGTLATLNLLRRYLGWSILLPSMLILMSPGVPVEISLILTGLVGVSFAPILPLLISICGNMFASHAPHGASHATSATSNINANGTLISIIGILFFSNMGSGTLPMLTGLVAQRLSIRLAMWIGVACSIMVNLIVNLLTILYKRRQAQSSNVIV
eukprot:TRINITY_DN1065_c0_g1_i1.p1 TRINITY_DN1065_c0_g1~~TRINITY_DN1065_c0_g1_i1.p1  ORF type:complete len:510 (+),score=138.42 TRINITY_DN1065_c0_g1_i1:108-1637(+)